MGVLLQELTKTIAGIRLKQLRPFSLGIHQVTEQYFAGLRSQGSDLTKNLSYTFHPRQTRRSGCAFR
jgi:hypothetical protein